MNKPNKHPDDKLIRLMKQHRGISNLEVKSSVEHYFDHGKAGVALTCAAALISEVKSVPIALVEALVTSAELHDTKIAEYLDPKQLFRSKDQYST